MRVFFSHWANDSIITSKKITNFQKMDKIWNLISAIAKNQIVNILREGAGYCFLNKRRMQMQTKIKKLPKNVKQK